MAQKKLSTSAPNKTGTDTAYALTKAVLSAVPVTGGPLVELFAYLITEPVAKRRDEWIEQIAGGLQDLEDRLKKPLIDDLRNDPGFTTVLLSATQIAMRNHQTEKIEALANAVLNSAMKIPLDDTERAMMLALVDRTTPMHLALLRLIQAPKNDPNVAKRMESLYMGSLDQVVIAAFPELSGSKELVDLVWNDLSAAGLLQGGSLAVSMTGGGLVQKRTTAFGDRFLAFISKPNQTRWYRETERARQLRLMPGAVPRRSLLCRKSPRCRKPARTNLKGPGADAAAAAFLNAKN